MEKLTETKKEMEKITKINNTDNEINKITKILLQNNLNVRIFEETTPAICEIWNKYTGKHYGEKTAEKIKNEIENNFNCDVFIYIYHNGILINLRDETKKYNNNLFESVHIITKDYNKRLLNNNVIQEINADDLQLSHGETYTEDINKTIKQLKEKHAQALQLQAELLQLHKEINTITAGKINPITYNYIVKNWLI